MKYAFSFLIFLSLTTSSFSSDCFKHLETVIEANKEIVSNNKFSVGRGINKYKDQIGAGFAKHLAKSKVWVDMGAGMGVALIENAKLRPDMTHIGIVAEKPSLNNTAMGGFENKLKDETVYNYYKQNIENLDNAIDSNLINYHHGKFLEEIEDIESVAKKGSVDLISDFYGVFSYSPNFNQVLEIYHSLLKVGGKAYLVNIGGMVVINGERIPLRAFINKYVKGFKIDNSDRLVKGFSLEKTEETLRIPMLELDFMSRGMPPVRRFKLVKDQ